MVACVVLWRDAGPSTPVLGRGVEDRNDPGRRGEQAVEKVKQELKDAQTKIKEAKSKRSKQYQHRLGASVWAVVACCCLWFAALQHGRRAFPADPA